MEKLELLDDNEVISDIHPDLVEELELPRTATTSELIEALFVQSFSDEVEERILNQFSCCVLRYNQSSWAKGRLKICLAFISDGDIDRPDELAEQLFSEGLSPLEKIRQNSTEN